MRKVLKILAALAVVIAIGVGLKWNDIRRLHTVNTLFDSDKIVSNFSNMERAFLTRDVGVRSGEPLPRALEPLPQTVELAGQERDLEDFLVETDTTSLMVLRDGVVVAEDYRLGTGPEDQRISWSVAKSFLSALVGRAIARGDIPSVDADVVEFVPDLKGTAYEGASLRNVLNMASGVSFNEDYFDPDSDINRMGREIALGGSLDEFSEGLLELAYAPGEANQYVSIDTHVAGRVLRAATGRDIYSLFREAFDPVGLGPVRYITDGEDEAFVLGGLLMTTEGFAKFGQLFLQEGTWDGQQIIPADWVAESTVISAPPPLGGDAGGRSYGYQWWMLPDQAESGYGDYFANGIYGQSVYVNPALNVVIVKTSADPEFRDLQVSGMSTTVETIRVMRRLAEHYAGSR